MKNLICLFAYLFANMCMISSYAQYTTCKSERVITEKKVSIFSYTENGWKQKDGKAYYYDKTTAIIPVSYKSEISVDSIYIIDGKTKSVNSRVIEESAGFYNTSEPGWEWKKKDWYYNGSLAKSFPPSFTKKAVISTTINNGIGNITKKTTDLTELYQVESGWSWSSQNTSWLLNGKPVNFLPVYIVTSSIKSTVIPNK